MYSARGKQRSNQVSKYPVNKQSNGVPVVLFALLPQQARDMDGEDVAFAV
jgi:hypothetical protein